MKTTDKEQQTIQLFLQQKQTLDLFLSRGAISKAQYDKSLGDLIKKMDIVDPDNRYKCRAIMGDAIMKRGLSNAKGVTLVNYAASLDTLEEREVWALEAADIILKTEHTRDILPKLGLQIQSVPGCEDWDEEAEIEQ